MSRHAKLIRPPSVVMGDPNVETCTVAETALVLGYSLTTARRLAAVGKLPGQLPRLADNAEIRVSRAQLRAYVRGEAALPIMAEHSSPNVLRAHGDAS